MIHIALYEPEIPPNTGNIIRLCANLGAQLHLIKPLGFALDDQKLKRAGLDYHEFSSVKVYENFAEFSQKHVLSFQKGRIFACTTKARQLYYQHAFLSGDILLFGPESRGLPAHVLDSLAEHQKLRIPMQSTSRSLNLSNAVAILAYEALRQLDFPELD